MKQKNKMLSTHGIKTLFETRLTQLTSLASESQDETAFKNKLNDYLLSGPIYNPAAARQIKRLIDNDGKTIYEASTEQEIKIETISLLWKFLTNRIINEEISVDLWIDLYHQFDRLYHEEEELPDEKQVQQWMKRWPSGLNEDVRAIRRQNKERIISLLIQKIENRHAPSSRYLFPEGSTEEDKRRLVCQWWNEARFHLAMAVKNPTELNRMLGNSLSEETLQLYHKARKKGMPVFITPYYLSLLNPTGKGYDDEAIRSYILYSSQLVETYGNIHAWEKEDAVEDGKPNAAGWLLPDGHNIHRRYPDVAILIPDSMGRACGGLCASCQRMYDFQSERQLRGIETERELGQEVEKTDGIFRERHSVQGYPDYRRRCIDEPEQDPAQYTESRLQNGCPQTERKPAPRRRREICGTATSTLGQPAPGISAHANQ